MVTLVGMMATSAMACNGEKDKDDEKDKQVSSTIVMPSNVYVGRL